MRGQKQFNLKAHRATAAKLRAFAANIAELKRQSEHAMPGADQRTHEALYRLASTLEDAQLELWLAAKRGYGDGADTGYFPTWGRTPPPAKETAVPF